MRRAAWNRVARLLLMVLLAHLSFVGNDAVCAPHSAGHAAMMRGMTHGMTREMPRAMADAPCQVPSSAHCCDAMTGCAITLALVDGVGHQQMLMDDVGVPNTASDTPASLRTAPEPPPPKA